MNFLCVSKRRVKGRGYCFEKDIRIGLLGASGYTGAEIVRLVANHPHFGVTLMTADRKAGQSMDSVFPHLTAQKLPRLISIKDADFSTVDAVFCCLPHGTTQVPILLSLLIPLHFHIRFSGSSMDVFFSQEIIKRLPTSLNIVDLSAVKKMDFRLRDISEYEEWYGQPHKAVELQKEVVYGLTELLRDDIKKALLVANPGCYPTSVQLPLVPLLKDTGAKEANLYSEIAEGISSYGVTRHRHVPEIEQGLSDVAQSKVTVSFTPHLMPMIRGMQSTIYVEMAPGVRTQDLYQQLKSSYEVVIWFLLWGDGIKPMKTVRPDEFGSPYSKDSILSIANSNNNQTR
ncbi:hypothetical protein YC2023_118511 [Brassica napus]